jgi:hypothetical protein
MSRINAALAVLALIVSTVVLVAAPASAACSPSTKTLSGTIQGEDGRFIHALIGVDLFAGGTQINAQGCADPSAAYEYALTVNTQLGPDGATSGGGLTKTWSVQVPANATRAFIEVYPRSAFTDPPGKTVKTRYGMAMEHDTPVGTGIDLRLPLNCGLAANGAVGRTGAIEANVFRNGNAVTPTSVLVFSLGQVTGVDLKGMSVGDIRPGGFRADALAGDQHYQVLIIQGGSVRRLLWIPLNGCADLELNVDMNPAAIQTVPGATFYLSNDLNGSAESTLLFGFPGNEPVAMDWDGNGLDDIGVRSGNTFELRDSITEGPVARRFSYGRAGDELFIGDWDGNGTDTPAVRRGNQFFLRNDTFSGPAHLTLGFGKAGDEVFVGDWNGDGKDTFSVRRGNIIFLRNDLVSGPATTVFGYGRAGDEMFVGDWNGNRNDTFAVRRSAKFFVRNSTISGPADTTFSFGEPTDQVLVGDWNANGADTFGLFR